MSPSRIALLSILLSAASGLALAQDAGPRPGGPSAEHGRWDPAEMREHMQARQAERAKALHDVLAIQPAQEAAFAAFTTAMARHDGDRFRDGADEAEPRMPLSTPRRLDRRKSEMDRRFAAMREAFDRRAAAMKALYAALDPRQRAAMDALPELSGRHGGRDHGGRMGPPGPMGAGM